METRIAGIPCIIRLDRVIGRYLPAKIYAEPEYCYEAQYPEVEFTVCDRRGRPAPWLERKMTMAEGMAIEAALLEISDD